MSNNLMNNDAPEREPRRAERPKKRRKQFPIIPIFFILCVALIAAAGATFVRDWTMPVDAKSDVVKEVTVENGMTVDSLGNQLEEDGLIRSATSFKLYVRAKGVAQDIQAGVHELSPSMSLEQIVKRLRQSGGEIGATKLTVTEGMTIDQIAELIASKSDYKAQDFLDLMTDDEYLVTLLDSYPFLADTFATDGERYALEGYLFPSTYDFDSSASLDTLVRQMLNKTSEIVAAHQAEIDASEYSLHQILTMASLVEKEGVTTEDRKAIAGVFYNRLAIDMPIQSDISVLYALGTHKEVVTLEDLEVDSPYNLYTNVGLPPGPMNNPGEDAILATLNADQNDYLYFYANIKTGEVFFTADYDQHIAWQKEYEETGTIQGN